MHFISTKIIVRFQILNGDNWYRIITVFENANVLEWVKHQVTHLIFFIKKNINIKIC